MENKTLNDKKKFEFVIWNVIWILLFCCFASLVFAAISNRPLFSDGGWWTFDTISRGFFSFDGSLLRITDRLLQVPAILSIRLGYGESAALLLNNLSYSLVPFLGLLASAWILKLKDRFDLFVIPVLSFAAVTQTSVGDPSGQVSSLLTIVWPLFFLTVLPKKNLLTYFVISALTLGLAMGHESGVFFILMMVVIEIIKISRVPKETKNEFFILIGIFTTASLWFFYRIFGPIAGPSQTFFSSLKAPWDSFGLVSLLLIIFSILAFFKPSKISQNKWLGCLIFTGVVASLYTLTRMQFEHGGLIMWNTYRARATGMIIVSVMSFFSFLVIRFNERLEPKKKEYRTLLLITTFALFISLVHDLKLTSLWRKSTNNITKFLSAEPGCRELTEFESKANLLEYGFYLELLPVVSIVLSQETHGKVGTVLFSETVRQKKYKNIKNLCCFLAKGEMPYSDPYHNVLVEPDWNYKVMPAVDAAKAALPSYGCEDISGL